MKDITKDDSSNILIVEDNPINRKILVKGLSHSFSKIIDVEGTTRALKLAKDYLFDIFLLDIHMPVMNGLEFAKILKNTKRYENTPIIFITGSQDREEMKEGYSVGGVDFILKPYNMLEIISKVRVHLELASKNSQLSKYASQMEELANTRAQQLIQADRLSLLGTISASVAHEINNPLSFISSNIQILEKYWAYIGNILLSQDDLIKSDKQLLYIQREIPIAFEEMKIGIKRVSNIAHKLKSFVHKPIDKDRSEEVLLMNLVNSAVAMAKPEAKNKVIFKIMIRDSQVRVKCVKEEIIQVLLNLYINAIHALEPIEKAEIISECEIMPNQILLHVTDNGCGIPENYISKIFEPFFTTKEKGKGTGLGLSISKDILLSNNGDIVFKNMPNGGARFTLIFNREDS